MSCGADRMRFAILGVWLLSTPLLAQLAPAEGRGKYSTPLPIRRYALVVGIGDYHQIDKVKNATNDAHLVAKTLALPELGFDDIRILRDDEADNKIHILQAAKNLADRAAIPDTAATIVFYFAGHGYQVDNVNYLAPRLARKPRMDSATGKLDKSVLKDDGLSIGNILSVLQSARRPGVTILMLDACRTNIFSGGLEKRGADEQEGFYEVKTEDSQRAVLSFAASFGKPAKSASRLTQNNSPYASAVAELIVNEGAPLQNVLVSLRSLVSQYTDDKQTTEDINSAAAGTHFYFHRGEQNVADEKASWFNVRDMTRKKCVVDYLAHYPDGYYAQHAMNYIRDEPASSVDIRTGETPCVLLYP